MAYLLVTLLDFHSTPLDNDQSRQIDIFRSSEQCHGSSKYSVHESDHIEAGKCQKEKIIKKFSYEINFTDNIFNTTKSC